MSTLIALLPRSRMARNAVLGFAALLLAAVFYLIVSATLLPRAFAQPIAPARAAALVDATTGEKADDVRAIGDQAKLINASMPFDRTPVLAARAFVIPADDDVDHRRALLCLTQAVYYEAGFEPIEGRRAVAQVVLNRTKHPAFPKSVCGVVYQRNSTPVCQFSFVCDGALDRRPEAGAWRVAQQIAAAALAGFVEGSVGAATHYHADYVAPRWAPLLAKTTKIGAHIFYRWPGAWGQPAAFTGRYIGEPRDPATMRPLILARTDDIPANVEAVIAQGPVTDGTLLKRAPNDVGGLLDTSKGWTLNIPVPGEGSSAIRRVAEQEQSKISAPAPATTQNDAAPHTRVIASR
jgi:hypothetical protein